MQVPQEPVLGLLHKICDISPAMTVIIVAHRTDLLRLEADLRKNAPLRFLPLIRTFPARGGTRCGNGHFPADAIVETYKDLNTAGISSGFGDTAND